MWTSLIPMPRRPDGGVAITEQVVGTWTFTAPPTVTRVERKTADFDRFSLYTGIPAPTDVPFLVITVSRDRTSLAETDADNYKVSGKREYVMNGNIAQEWTGLTKSGAGFCELIVRKPARPARPAMSATRRPWRTPRMSRKWRWRSSAASSGPRCRNAGVSPARSEYRL